MDQIAATIGNFDGVHLGHRHLIDVLKVEAAKRGLTPAVITFDRPPVSVVAPDRPYALLSTLDEKVSLLKALGVKVIVLHFDKQMASMDAETFMRQVLSETYSVRFLLIGYDHRFGHNRTQGFDDYCQIGQTLGMELMRGLELAMSGDSVSSSRIRRALADAKITEANALLGHPYAITGRVVGGMRVGRTIGFPTANLLVSDTHKLLPPHGVYGVYVYHQQRRLGGMLYIGNRPSLDNGAHVSIEVNIFHLDEDLYDAELRLDLLFYERGDCKFDSLEALRLQIEADRQSILQKIDC